MNTDINFANNLEYCWQFVEEIKDLLFYSHIPITLVTLFVGIYVYRKDTKSLLSKILLSISVCFSLWAFLDLSIWLNFEKASVLMFSWAPIEIFSCLLFVLSLYFVYVFTEKKDISVWIKLFLFTLLFPLILITPTADNLVSYNLDECVANENINYLNYVLGLKIFLSTWLISLLAVKLSRATGDLRKQIAILSLGILSFLFAFFISGEISQRTGNFTFELYGLFGILIFIACLAYLIIKFKTFNIRILSAQILVGSLIVLIASQYTFSVDRLSAVLTSFTVFLAIIFSYILVRGVKREIEQRERIERLAQDLEKANVRLKELDHLKSDFLSFASHQIRSPLTAIKGYTSLILEGDFGKINQKAMKAIQTIDTSAQSLIVIVNEFLDISRIEQGRMKYEFITFDVTELVKTIVAELRPTVEGKGLKFTFSSDAKPYMTHADKGKIKQVLGNIIDNALKYTPAGSIDVSVASPESGKIQIIIKDTGIGIDADTIPTLFSKFSRAKDAHKTNVSGTGLGLYVARTMLEAQKGTIRVQSDGKGKGSQFIIELDSA